MSHKKKSKHRNFKVSGSGLVIHPSYPLMGSSPDSFVEYDCCGRGVIKVKCSYSCKQESITKKASEDNHFFLKVSSGNLYLDIYHSYILLSGASSAEVLLCFIC